MKIVQKWSPNQSERIHGDAAVRLIVCHTPEGSYQGTINYICDPNAARKVSYHMPLSLCRLIARLGMPEQ
jgi:hypothetical protein